MKILYVDFFQRWRSGDLYFQDDAHDIYIRWDAEKNMFYVKFKGMDEYAPAKGAEIIADTFRQCNVITKDEYYSGKNQVYMQRFQHPTDKLGRVIVPSQKDE